MPTIVLLVLRYRLPPFYCSLLARSMAICYYSECTRPASHADKQTQKTVPIPSCGES